MRLPSYRFWLAVFALCASSGCATFDRPIGNATVSDSDARDQRLIDEANRKLKARDYDGAKRILDQLDTSRPSTDSQRIAADTRDSGIQQVGHQVTAPSREDMIRDLTKDLPGDRRLQEAQRYREMQFTMLKQLHANQQQAANLGHRPVVDQREIARNLTTPGAVPNSTFGAPDPRQGSLGVSSPWTNGPTDGSALNPSNVNVLSNNLASNAASNAAATPQPNNLTSNPSTAAAAVLAVTGNGVSLEGIQPAGNAEAAKPTAAANGNLLELPSINPAPAGTTSMPSINPRRAFRNEFAADAIKPGPIEQVNAETAPGSLPPSNSASPIPQPNGNGPLNSVPTSPFSNTTNATNGASVNGATTGPGNAPGIPGNLPGGSPATLQPNITELPNKQGPSPLAPLDRVRTKLSNPLPGGVQNLTRTLGFGNPGQPQALAGDMLKPAVNVGDLAAVQSMLITQLESQLASAAPGTSEEERLKYIKQHVNLRMLYLISGRNDQAIEPIKGLDVDEQEFWQHLAWSVANYFDAQGQPRSADRATQTVAALRTATLRLKSQADLQLHNVTFCQRIDSYGNFERLSRDRFPPGSAVLLYAEVENFKSAAVEGDRNKTSLKSTIEFYKAGDTRLIQDIHFKETLDFCRSKRRDFFLAFEFTIPQQLEQGIYTLVLKTEDQLSQKVATSRVNFSVE